MFYFSLLIAILLTAQASLFALTAWIYARYAKRIRNAVTSESTSLSPIAEEHISFVVIVAKLSLQEISNALDLLDECARGHQVIFCAETANDPLIAVLREAIANKALDAQICFAPPPYGTNPKVDMMRLGLTQARNDIVAFVDGNAHLPSALPDHIKSAWIGNNCIVTTFPVAVGADSFWTQTEALLSNHVFTRWLVAADPIAGLRYVMGKLIVLRKSWLDVVGGPARLLDNLGEDTALAHLANSHHVKIAQTAAPVSAYLSGRTRAQVIERTMRWAKLRRNDVPVAFAFEAFYGTWGLCVMTALTAHLWALPVWPCVALAALFTHILDALMMHARTGTWSAELHAQIVIRDVLQMLSWFGAQLSSTYRWRG